MKKKNYFIIKSNRKITLNFLERILIGSLFVSDEFLFSYLFFIKKIFVKSLCFIHIINDKKKKVIKIIIINSMLKTLVINCNEKLVLLGVKKKMNIKWKKTFLLSKSKRNDGSFGSTGIL